MAASETMSSNPEPQTARMTMDALVKEHNLVVDLASENILLRRELQAMRDYCARLEGLLKEAIPEEPDGVQETQPVCREEVGQADEGQVP